ncbi:DUF1566 domain-containing protein [Vibrio coralliilyticus]|uniref:Lcl C-terminal domain-containing protein n=1 Tax=Vibrio coralliilyticus TaxID=190893 RepID=UPI0006CDFC56|nr:DUF1566 domain-containing protein [Vibrio coralliilyticus]AXN34407.1 DUF1566 domain-containing protein [Vibrio coralliilyticus]KPH24065.1 HutR like protein [Vibrio coralliilyticus]
MNKVMIGLALFLVSASASAVQECAISIAKTAPNVRYAFNTNGTVKDRTTGLTWMRCQLGKAWNSSEEKCEGDATGMFWQAALNEVQSINQSQSNALYQFAGKSNWRLPNIKELMSLAEHSCRTPALNNKAFNQAFPWVTSDGNILSYVWSNSHIQEASEILVFDTRNAETLGYGPTLIKGSVLLVTNE